MFDFSFNKTKNLFKTDNEILRSFFDCLRLFSYLFLFLSLFLCPSLSFLSLGLSIFLSLFSSLCLIYLFTLSLCLSLALCRSLSLFLSVSLFSSLRLSLSLSHIFLHISFLSLPIFSLSISFCISFFMRLFLEAAIWQTYVYTYF